MNPQEAEADRFLKPATVVDFLFFANSAQNVSCDKIRAATEHEGKLREIIIKCGRDKYKDRSQISSKFKHYFSKARRKDN